MKAQNKEEKLAKQQEREKLQREIAAREKAERIQSEYEDRLKKKKSKHSLDTIYEYCASRRQIKLGY